MSNSGPLFEAIRGGDATRVAALLDDDPSLLAASENDTSAILTAVYYGHAALAALFIDRGVQLSLPEACALGEETRARELLHADPSSIDGRSTDGHVPVALAIFFGHPALARTLIERGADVNAHAANAQRVAPLHAAVAVVDRATMALLLERGADPNGRQQLDYTALHTAAGRGDVESATLLLAHGAKRELRGTDGKSPLDLAREKGQAAFAKWFTRSG
jgi:ankyrin repeat protein